MIRSRRNDLRRASTSLITGVSFRSQGIKDSPAGGIPVAVVISRDIEISRLLLRSETSFHVLLMHSVCRALPGQDCMTDSDRKSAVPLQFSCVAFCGSFRAFPSS